MPSKLARWAPLVALTAMNLLNYIDRYVITSLLPLLQTDLHMSDVQAGLLGSGFMVVYFVVSPMFGWLGDRQSRPPLLALGVLLWSLATVLTGTCQSYPSLFLARAAVGVGESAYGSIAPSLITDLFAKLQHGRALSLFYLATPVGSALGYVLGGVVGTTFGWRAAFYAVGCPGLLMALWALRLQDPARLPRPRSPRPPSVPHVSWPRRLVRAWWRASAGQLTTVRQYLLRSRLYIGTVAGLTAYTFGLGGFAFWAPSFMIRERGYTAHDGMILFGGITVVTGAIGTLAGGVIGDWLKARTVRGYSYLNTLAVTVGAFGALVCLICEREWIFLTAMAIAQLSLFTITGPVNALIVGVVPASVRGTAMASSIFCIHLFGDAISPVIIGRLSDSSGLRYAMGLVPISFLLAAIIWASTLIVRRQRVPS